MRLTEFGQCLIIKRTLTNILSPEILETIRELSVRLVLVFAAQALLTRHALSATGARFGQRTAQARSIIEKQLHQLLSIKQTTTRRILSLHDHRRPLVLLGKCPTSISATLSFSGDIDARLPDT